MAEMQYSLLNITNRKERQEHRLAIIQKNEGLGPTCNPLHQQQPLRITTPKKILICIHIVLYFEVDNMVIYFNEAVLIFMASL